MIEIIMYSRYQHFMVESCMGWESWEPYVSTDSLGKPMGMEDED